MLKDLNIKETLGTIAVCTLLVALLFGGGYYGVQALLNPEEPKRFKKEDSNLYQYGQRVKIIDKESIFAQCEGKIQSGRMTVHYAEAPEARYGIVLTSCPYTWRPDKLVEEIAQEHIEPLE